ncbi:hypothetical protein [Clostridium saccharoperbutylacetonicum]|uniref:hypothetical protein n=1 Tax=Clostridium saccharoperbutylacetonicum TaxID=36745 RepID=UPI0039E7BC8A
MFNNFVILECNVVFKDEDIKEINRVSEYENANKTLTINIAKNKEYLESISEKELKKYVKRYIEKNKFNGIKNIDFDEIMPYTYSNFFIYAIFVFLNKLFDNNNIVKKIEESKFINKILIIIGFLILYFFYNLGYTFLYGYYFGGNTVDRISFLQMYVNPVPFNFKSIVGIGLGLFIYILLIGFPLAKILKAKNKKEVIGNGVIFVFIVMCLVICSAFLFIGTLDRDVIFTDMIYFIFIFITLPITIFIMLLFAKYSNKYTLVFLGGVVDTIVIVSLVVTITNKIANDYIELLIVYGMYVIPIILTHILNIILMPVERIKSGKLKICTKYTIIFAPVSIIISLLIRKWFKVEFFSARFVLCIVISIAILIIVILIINSIYGSDKSKGSREKTEILSDGMKKTPKENYTNYKYAIIGGLVLGIFMFSIVPNVTLETGKMVRNTLRGLSKDKIIYEKADDKKESQYVFGDIVAQKDNIYFVSKLPERKLMTIKNTNVFSVPCDEFWININLDKFIELNNNFNNKYSYLTSNDRVKLIENPKEISLNSNSMDFHKSAYIQNSSNINEDNYDFGISFDVQYSMKDTKVDKFSLVFEYKFPNNINNEDDKKMKKEMESMFSDYKNNILQHFNVPVLNVQTQKYYYSNGLIKFSSKIDSEKNGRYEEQYNFSSVED